MTSRLMALMILWILEINIAQQNMIGAGHLDYTREKAQGNVLSRQGGKEHKRCIEHAQPKPLSPK